MVDTSSLQNAEDVLRGFECGIGGGAIGLHSDPDRGGADEYLSAIDHVLIVPAETDKVYGIESDLVAIERFNNLQSKC